MSESICPCQGLDFPKPNWNPPGLDLIEYRVGDYVVFRESLLLSQPGEVQLKVWRPDASGDLAVQMIEWWAVLGDILSLYNRQIANDSYLRTASSDVAVNRLIRILGYRPRPGIGATGMAAAILDGSKTVKIPSGFQIQSKPSDGEQPQIFEADAAVTLTPPQDFITVAKEALKMVDSDGSVRLSGSIDSLKKGDTVLLVKRGWTSSESDYFIREIDKTEVKTDLLGQTYTRVAFTLPLTTSSALADDYQLLVSQQFSSIWHFGDGSNKTSTLDQTELHLVDAARSIRPNDLLMLEYKTSSILARGISKVETMMSVSGTTSILTRATGNFETIWYLNDANDPATPPSDTNIARIIAQHSRLTLSPAVSASWTNTGTAYYGWRETGTLVGVRSTSVSGTNIELEAVDGTFPELTSAEVLLEDASGAGELGTAIASGSEDVEVSELPDPPDTLQTPVTVHLGTFPVSRGQTVANEILGSGDASIENQEFTLKKSPVTYLAGDSTSGDGYASTISVWVDGVQWTEVQTLYGQAADAKVFVTFEDEDEATHVKFGSRLPTGTDNVIATYRIGSGAETPESGQLSIILSPIDGLTKIVSPAPLTPGSDPDPADQVRRYAPNSVLTFGRAVSGDDYETIAAQAPGVTRAKAYWQWDETSQRATVAVYVGDSEGARSSAFDAIAAAADPNRRILVKLATSVSVHLSFKLKVDSRYVSEDVEANVRAALLDGDSGLFGVNVVQIGQIFFDSDIYARCHSVAGVVAVQDLKVVVGKPVSFFLLAKYRSLSPIGHIVRVAQKGVRHDPGEGAYFTLADSDLTTTVEVDASA